MGEFYVSHSVSSTSSSLSSLNVGSLRVSTRSQSVYILRRQTRVFTMEAEVLDRIQKMKLTMDEDEVRTIRSVKRDEILEEFFLNLVG